MRYVFIILVCVIAGCKSQPSTSNSSSESSSNNTSEIQDRTMSDSAKQMLIDISSTAWMQVQAAEVALKKSHDTSILSMAQHISKQYERVKDKAKIVSIPYRMNMPYFLTHDQNDQVEKLKSLDDASLIKNFPSQIETTNEVLTQDCNTFESLSKGDSDILRFITFTRSVVDETNTLIQERK